MEKKAYNPPQLKCYCVGYSSPDCAICASARMLEQTRQAGVLGMLSAVDAQTFDLLCTQLRQASAQLTEANEEIEALQQRLEQQDLHYNEALEEERARGDALEAALDFERECKGELDERWRGQEAAKAAMLRDIQHSRLLAELSEPDVEAFGIIESSAHGIAAADAIRKEVESRPPRDCPRCGLPACMHERPL